MEIETKFRDMVFPLPCCSCDFGRIPADQRLLQTTTTNLLLHSSPAKRHRSQDASLLSTAVYCSYLVSFRRMGGILISIERTLKYFVGLRNEWPSLATKAFAIFE